MAVPERVVRVAVVHNSYQQGGGEDVVVQNEVDVLSRARLRVDLYTTDNDRVGDHNPLALAIKTIWNRSEFRLLTRWLSQRRPQVVHVHNTLPLISPAVYSAAHATGAAVVQTLHNFRFLCPSATLYRDGMPCELCVGKAVPWPGVLHACYRGSRAATSAVAAMLVAHRIRGTYRHEVDHYIALTDFAKETFVRGGLPGERITVKPNSVADAGTSPYEPAAAMLTVGRLSDEKGIHVLADAWRRNAGPLPLRVVGDGPMRPLVDALGRDVPSVTVLGRMSFEDVQKEYRSASALVFPSTCYESLPMTIVEAYAAGLPVIASRLGAMAEVVHDGRTGLHFDPGDPDDLARKVAWFRAHPDEACRMSVEARREYELRYTPERNLEQLLAIYETAIERFRSAR